MSTIKAITRRRLILPAFSLLLAACAHNDEISEIATNVPVMSVAGSYWGYSETKELSQNSLIALRVPDVLYAREVSPEELNAYKAAAGFGDMQTQVQYVGTRNGFHYFMYKAFFESRQILKVRQEDYAVLNVVPLSREKEDGMRGGLYGNMAIDLDQNDLGIDPAKWPQLLAAPVIVGAGNEPPPSPARFTETKGAAGNWWESLSTHAPPPVLRNNGN